MGDDPQDLLRLADEVAAATGPDRELDCMIWAAVNGLAVVWTGADDHILIIDGHVIGSIDPGKHSRNFGCNRRETGPGSIPAFTASLDAAMTLAPDGWYLRVEPRFYSEEEHVRWRAHAIRPDWSRSTPYDDWFDTIENIDADQPALALCAAALKARAHSTKESDNG